MADGRSISKNRMKDAPFASLSQKHQSTYLQRSMNAGETNNSNSSIQCKPSKAFREKCATTQQTILEQIKVQYHDQLRSLYQNELNADIIVQIGENFSKPLHKCILASRVFRFYSTLKLFEFESSGLYIHEVNDNKLDLSSSNSLDQSAGTEDYRNNTDLSSHSKQVFCIPSELISQELFKNFARRIYLDEDVRDEELRLTTKFGDWLKINRPHLIKNTHIPNRYSPNHKATFRTIIPDFVLKESPTNSNNSRMAMSTEPDSIESTSSNNRVEFLDKTYTPTPQVEIQQDGEQQSYRQEPEDNSGTFSALPRTETFERISSKLEGTNLDAQPSSLDENDGHSARDGENNSTLKSFTGKGNLSTSQSSNMNAHLNSSQDDNRSDYGADISSADGSNAPTPTSNAKLSFPTSLSSSKDSNNVKTTLPSKSPHIVPKQITSTLTNQKSTSYDQAATRSSSITNIETTNKNRVTSTSSSSTSTSPANKIIQSSIATTKAQEHQPVAQKRATSITATTRALPSSKTTTTKAQQPSNLIVTRAKPISLERAQSPVLMGKQSRHPFKSTIANKVQTRQTIGGAHDRRISGTPQQQTGYDSETFGSEISDSGSYALESSSVPGGYISIDRYTLASYSKLAEAMTRMFLDEIEADVTISVGGSKQIRAHKCILAARSAYLAEAIEKQHNISLKNNDIDNLAIIKDFESPEHRNRVEDTKQTYINLADFSYSSVHFAVLHLYSGIVKVTDDLELEELAKLTYLLHVGTLRQVCQHNLRMTYCHFFHKPCNICTLGVLKTLPLAWRYDYSDLYAKCLQWIGTHFSTIFCLKEFSELCPTDLIEECYSATLNQLQPDNVIQRTLECQKLLKNLPRVKWTESIIGLVGRQLEDFCHYVADNYDKIIQTESFMSLGKNCWECEILEENLLAAMNHLKPDMGCRCLVLLHKIECSNEAFSDDSANHYSESFSNLVCKMRKYCERYLIREATQVVHCSSWKQMNPSLQRKIKDQALITVDFEDPTRHLSNKPKLTSSIGKRSGQPLQASHHHSGHNSSSEDSNRPGSASRPRSGLGAQLPPMKNKKIVSCHVKVLK